MSIKILFAEDEPSLSKIVKESLETRDYTVYAEADGNKVVNRFMREQPDICVLDIMMPGKDGYEIAEKIREKSESVPIIFLTAKTQTEDLLKGFAAGGNDYIRKPFSMEELIVRVEQLLKRNAGVGKNEILSPVIIGKFSFDPYRQLLISETEERKLSFRESELLRLLYFNRDRITDRRLILNTLWGNDNFFNSRSLDVYITKLRAYLKPDSGIQIITVKGAGYRFITM